jgi:glycosyltransferase involved in cell wall biosynthesis
MISVVIPTLNSQAGLPRCFEGLLDAAMSGLAREVIVADGGSTDDTLFIADAAGARIVEAPKGRSTQLIKGADIARSDWLLFLHADTALEAGWEDEAISFIGTSTPEQPRAAAFRFALDDFGPPARRQEAAVAIRCWLFGLPYGDQGLLIPARFYRKLGGYRPIAAMEDVDLIRRIGRKRLIMLQSRAISGARARPSVSRSLRNFGIAFLSALRVPTPYLARLGE